MSAGPGPVTAAEAGPGSPPDMLKRPPAGVVPEAPTDLADRYRTLVAELDEASLRAHGDRAARARAHRHAAEVIRDRVEDVWVQVADPLLPFGISELDQLRPEEGAKAGGLTLAKEPDVDPAKAPGEAHRLCMRAMTQAAELRAVSRGNAGGVPPMLVAGVASVLAGGAVALARLASPVPGVGCLAAAVLAVAFVAALIGKSGTVQVLRAGLLGGGAAGIAVLATAPGGPKDPAGVIGSLALIILGIRWGLGIGGGSGKGSGGAGGGRKK